MTWLFVMSTDNQTFVTWLDCVTWLLNIVHLWHDMTVRHEYWITDICVMTLYKFVTWVLKIRLLCHDMSGLIEYWISDICVMTCYDCVSWELNIRHLWHAWFFDMSTDYETFVTLYDMSVRHDYCITAYVTWHDMTVWHE